MAKDSYWFKHDSTAGRGTRMRKMAFIYGHWGKGIYWDVIEILRDQDGYCFDKDETSIQMLCDLIGCKDPIRFENWFNDCIKINLLQVKDDKFYSEVLIENMGVWEIKKINGSKGGRPKKTETKPKRNQRHNRNDNLNETKGITEPITEPKANQNHKIIEDNRIVYLNREILLNDLPNSSHLVEISRVLKITVDQCKSMVSFFAPKAQLEYSSQKEFINHFKNWLPDNLHLLSQASDENLSKEELLEKKRKAREEYDRKTNPDNL